MRTLCDSCEAAAAQFFCAADEAALCAKCDEKVHSCNKLASRHIRLQLREAWSVPRCDICETAPGSFSVCYFSCKLFTGPQILQLSCIVVSMDHPYVFSVTWMFIKEAKELTKDTCCWDREWSFQMDFIIKRSMVTQETWRLLQRIGRKSTVRSTFIVQFPVRKLMLNQMVTSIMRHLVMAKKSENSYYYKGTNILHLKFKEYYRAWCYQLFGSWHVFPCIDLIGFSLAFKTDFHLFIMRFENAYLNIKMFSDLLISLYLTLHCLCHFLFVIAL